MRRSEIYEALKQQVAARSLDELGGWDDEVFCEDEQPPPSIESYPEILIPEEAAEILRVGIIEIEKGLSDGKIPGSLKIGDEWRIKKQDLLAQSAPNPSSSSNIEHHEILIPHESGASTPEYENSPPVLTLVH